MEKKERFLGSLIGLAVGDCVGAAIEFSPRGTYEPVTDMIGGGPHRLKPGEWTDDTSMALCLAESLAECKGFDAGDQMERYAKWHEEGYLSSTGVCFDIGIATEAALDRYRQTGDPYSGSADPWKAGNGSIMRLAPVPLVWSQDFERAIHFSGESSKTTHQSEETIDACYYFGALIAGAVNGIAKDKLLSKKFASFVEEKTGRPLSPRIGKIAEGSFRQKQPQQISGSGYVVDSLEAALWAFYLSDTFKEGLLLVVNLGEDSDTTGAIYGQLAGAYYGLSSIPTHWVEKIVRLDSITDTALKLYELHTELSPFAYQGTACEYGVLFNEQDFSYYKITLDSQIEALLDGEWLSGIFKNSYIRTDYQWEVFFPGKKNSVQLPEGTQVRIKRDPLENHPEKAPEYLGSWKKYEQLRRKNRSIEAKKLLKL